MKITELISTVKTRLGVIMSSTLSAISASGGSASAVCQTTCSTSSGILPLLGISLAATPLAFMNDYLISIWQIALLFFLLLLIFYLRSKIQTKTDRALLIINAGLLIIGIPYLKETLIGKFSPYIGLGILAIGLYLFFVRKYQKIIFY